MYQDVFPFFHALAGRVRIGVLANQEETVSLTTVLTH